MEKIKLQKLYIQYDSNLDCRKKRKKGKKGGRKEEGEGERWVIGRARVRFSLQEIHKKYPFWGWVTRLQVNFFLLLCYSLYFLSSSERLLVQFYSRRGIKE